MFPVSTAMEQHHYVLIALFIAFCYCTWKFSTKIITYFTISSESSKQLNENVLKEITNLAGKHEAASVLASLVHEDGAGNWPPKTNHDHTTWPKALRPYKEIYLQLAPLLPVTTPSLDDDYNRNLITKFRGQFEVLLKQNIELADVISLLEDAAAGNWSIMTREIYNAFYACLAWSRHAYR